MFSIIYAVHTQLYVHTTHTILYRHFFYDREHRNDPTRVQ